MMDPLRDGPDRAIPPRMEIPPPLPKREGAGVAREQGSSELILGLGIAAAVLLLLAIMALFAVQSEPATSAEESGAIAGPGDAKLDGTLAEESAEDTAQTEDTVLPSNEQEKADEDQMAAASDDATVVSSPQQDSAEKASESLDSKPAVESGSGGAQDRELPVISSVPERQPVSNRSGRSESAASDLSASDAANPFIGQGKPAKSTVFVIDKSGSMDHSTKLERVLKALRRAIEQLKPNQSFAVLFFDDQYYRHPKFDKPQPASDKNKQMNLEWIQAVQSSGGTDPSEAMFQAIQWNVERIVLLTDGEFDPTFAALITARNQADRRPARIDCVGLAEEVEVLKEIARDNDGIYYQAK
jgi:hypothetical protein